MGSNVDGAAKERALKAGDASDARELTRPTVYGANREPQPRGCGAACTDESRTLIIRVLVTSLHLTTGGDT